MRKMLLRFSMFVVYPVLIVVQATAALGILGVRLSKRWVRPVAAIAAIVFVSRVALSWWSELSGWDFAVFWAAGRTHLNGGDPYHDPLGTMPFLYPPNVLPLFDLLAMAPERISFALWLVFNAGLIFCLVPLAMRALEAQDDGSQPTLDPEGAAALWAAVVLCNSALVGTEGGQLSALATVALALALIFQGRGRPILAGLALGVAAIKATTTLPYFLLFLRPRDWPAWLTCGVATALLCLLAYSPTELPGRILELPSLIGKQAVEGGLNDYSYAGTESDSVIGLEHAIYRLGIHDRRLVGHIAHGILLALGLWIAWEVVRGRLPRPATVSLVALLAVLFLYHRIYDTLSLVIPLVYATTLARTRRGASRWLSAAAALALLACLNPSRQVFRKLFDLSAHWGPAGSIVRALTLPYVTWCILLAILFIAIAARVGLEPRPTTATPTAD